MENISHIYSHNWEISRIGLRKSESMKFMRLWMRYIFSILILISLSFSMICTSLRLNIIRPIWILIRKMKRIFIIYIRFRVLIILLCLQIKRMLLSRSSLHKVNIINSIKVNKAIIARKKLNNPIIPWNLPII